MMKAEPSLLPPDLFQELLDIVGKLRPQRAVVDSITILQLLAGSPQRYHREVVTLRGSCSWSSSARWSRSPTTRRS